MPVRRWILIGLAAAIIALGLRYCIVIVPSDQISTMSALKQSLVSQPKHNRPHLRLPVDGVALPELVDTFRQSREEGHRVHDAIDILAKRGTAVRAAAPGVVEKLFVSARGGNTLYIRSPDLKWIYYYAHLDSYAAGIAEGDVVTAGELLGTVGSTGNANAGASHLHFAINRMAPAQRWYEGEPISPYPLLVEAMTQN